MTRAWVRELAGWMAAAAVSLITAATVAASARAELMFRDGDSLIVAMVARSLLAGDKLDWAMSSVLFLPESAGFAALDAGLPLGANGLFAVSAALNLLALYGAIRLVAGRSRPGSAPVVWSIIALAAFGALAMTETSASRDALELASLQLTTTYYSATVVAVVLAVGVVRRMLDRSARSIGLAVALGAVALVSTLTNPLFAVWATVPLILVLSVAALLDAGRRTRILTPSVILVGATGLGFVARIPFAAWIANTGAGYAQPELWPESIEYYGGLLANRLSTPPGILALVMTLALVTLAVVRTVRAPDVGSRLVAAAAWIMPLVVVVGAIALGTHAARYLQPVVFAPLLALVAAPRAVTFPVPLRRGAAVTAGALLLVGGALSIPRLADAAQQPDPDLACVTDWVDTSGRTGAGQFWTVRLPKLHLDDPSQLVQVDHRLNAYAWLVNRTDFAVGEVSFLVEDSQTVQWDLPVSAVPDEVVDCGRYSILDFGDATLPLGPAHS
ncbi:multisubunit Na+/H+ antiporter MnhF subunit [Microbacterium phyllosphaerae]|uniref:Multisubunit Na+/H+ antiporter MnhF subunit n=1 Tax=Microbacterium phyllosphaerae TaxID=124798 RepID=A0ABS4WNL9_9MICO|nr:hypothetical protein [Microbacterium phyllosphaerae]MBP2377139.1 multisubunit Na+/H+ antiporter MnhF subunit [Microbacterium phyllosphaerae]